MDVYVIKTTDADNIDENILKEFQKKEISADKKLKTHCFAYLMLDRIAKEVYKIQDRTVIFCNNKPKFKNNDLQFSISHSKEYIAIGFSKHICGIDIEEINSKRDYTSIAQRMHFNAQNIEEFYQCWTEYEAKYKLGKEIGAKQNWQIENYFLTAVSEFSEEQFELYMQN